MLAIARGAIAEQLGLVTPPLRAATWLEEPAATFVTITLRGKVRGCVGSLSARWPLGKDVKRSAQAAAFHDSRFDPLSRPEFFQCKLPVKTRNEVLHPARWWHRLGDGRVQCDLCPRDCKLGESQRGACFVRRNEDGHLMLTTYGRSSGLCVDPIEKKPLYHFHPGSRVLSFGTVGCNLMCAFCQNWDISKSRESNRLMDPASPEDIAQAAEASGCRSVAFTYNDPVVFAEYAMDAADACRARGIKTVAVTAGYIKPVARRELFAKMDAANVDLKAFTDGFYARLAGGRLQPVLDTLRYLRHETAAWLEITTLLIPGQNDSPEEIRAMSDWIAKELGPDVPLHVSAFHPAYRMINLPPTPAATLSQARGIARSAGLRFVYTGNVHDISGASTYCPACKAPLIVRDWHQIVNDRLTPEGRCPDCQTRIPGHFGEPSEPYGREIHQVHRIEHGGSQDPSAEG